MRKNALVKEFFMEIRKTKSRFLSIFLIVALGVAFFAGVRASAPDMRLSADMLYDNSDFMDIRVLGTLGITEDDIKAIEAIKGVEYVQGAYSADVLCNAEDVQLVVRMMSASENINKVTVTKGRMPEKKTECLADERFLSLSGYKIGDKIQVKSGTEDDIEDTLAVTEFEIVGCGTTPYYLSLDRGTSKIGNGELSSFLMIPKEAFSLEVYTEAVIRVEGAKDLLCFSGEYEEVVKKVENVLEEISDDQCEIRYETVHGDGLEELEKARDEISDSRQKLADAKKELDDGEKELANGEKKLSDAAEEIEKSEKEILQGQRELEDGEAQLQDGKKQIQDGWNTYYAGTDTLESKKQELLAGEKQVEDGENQLAQGKKEIDAQKKELEDARKTLEEGKLQLSQGKNQAEEGIAALEEGIAKIEENTSQIEAGLLVMEQQLPQIQDKIADLSQQLPALEANLELLNQEKATLQSEYDSAETEEEKVQIQDLIARKESEISLVSQQLKEGTASLSVLQNQAEELTAKKMEMEQTLSVLKEQQENLRKELAGAEEQLASLEEKEKELGEKEQLLETGRIQIEEAEKTLEQKSRELEGAKEQISSGRVQIAEGESQLQQTKELLTGKEAELLDAEHTIEKFKTELLDGRRQLEEGKQEYRNGKQELEENRIKLEDGKKEYQEKKQEADEKIAEAEEKIADGQEKLDTLEVPKWYILNRDYIQTYVEYEQDSDRIKAIGDVFPAIFFLVAALICLTTMTRMVEEERTQIGTLKALGYSKFSIAAKYLCYALTASLAGSILGLYAGQKILPPIIINAYAILYTSVKEIISPIHSVYSVSSTLLAIACTTLAAGAACYKELASSPAQLMRPAAPKSGKRVFLEKMGFIWNKLSFTDKSTVRNLFRYKKRFFMTVLGIGGCMGLLLVGFGLKDSIRSIGTIQYNDLMTYHAEIVLDEDVKENDREEVLKAMDEDKDILSYTAVYKTSMDIENQSGSIAKSTYVLVPEKKEELKDYIDFRGRVSGEKYTLLDDGIIISEKLAKLLDVREGDTVVLRPEETDHFEVKVSHITENYFLHYIYISPKLYEDIFGKVPDFNHYLTINASKESEFEDAMQSRYMAYDQISEVSFITKTADKIANMLKSMDTIIYVLVIAAGLLAFVVLYNLNNINISERIRELATLKVLGFYDKEVSGYVLRENICLTVIGSIIGIFIGRVLHRFVILTAEIDIMMFGRDIWPMSYLYSIVLTYLFSAVVNIFMHFRLKKVDMVESMKSVE